MSRLIVLVWLWLGAAMLFVAVVAPAAFAVLPSRAMAGLVVGRVLPVLFWSGAVIALLLMATTSGWRRVAAVVMFLTSMGAQLGVAPRIQRLRAALGPDIEAIDALDERRVVFGRLHAISVALLGIGLVGAAALAVGSLAPDGPGTPSSARSPLIPPERSPRG